jgi:hypothetical protein
MTCFLHAFNNKETEKKKKKKMNSPVSSHQQ